MMTVSKLIVEVALEKPADPDVSGDKIPSFVRARGLFHRDQKFDDFLNWLAEAHPECIAREINIEFLDYIGPAD